MDRFELIALIWDLYKDVYNVRPRGIDFDEMSLDELQTMYDKLCIALDALPVDDAFDDTDDGEALASAGWGTDEDYGGGMDYEF